MQCIGTCRGRAFFCRICFFNSQEHVSKCRFVTELAKEIEGEALTVRKGSSKRCSSLAIDCSAEQNSNVYLIEVDSTDEVLHEKWIGKVIGAKNTDKIPVLLVQVVVVIVSPTAEQIEEANQRALIRYIHVHLSMMWFGSFWVAFKL